MDKNSLKDIMWGGISELMNNRDYYRRSTVDPKYSEWYPRGKEALIEFVDFLTPMIDEAHRIELKNEAKRITLDTLKGTET